MKRILYSGLGLLLIALMNDAIFYPLLARVARKPAHVGPPRHHPPLPLAKVGVAEAASALWRLLRRRWWELALGRSLLAPDALFGAIRQLVPHLAHSGSAVAACKVLLLESDSSSSGGGGGTHGRRLSVRGDLLQVNVRVRVGLTLS